MSNTYTFNAGAEARTFTYSNVDADGTAYEYPITYYMYDNRGIKIISPFFAFVAEFTPSCCGGLFLHSFTGGMSGYENWAESGRSSKPIMVNMALAHADHLSGATSAM